MYSMSTILSLVVALMGTGQINPSRSPAANDGDVQIRINGPVHIATGDTASVVWVVNDNAT